MQLSMPPLKGDTNGLVQEYCEEDSIVHRSFPEGSIWSPANATLDDDEAAARPGANPAVRPSHDCAGLLRSGRDS